MSCERCLLSLELLAGGLSPLAAWAQIEIPAQDPTLPPEVTEGAEAIVHPAPSFMVRAEANNPTRTYREGQGLSLKVNSEQDAYLYVIYQQADGQAFQIFPNSKQKDNRVKAGQAV